MVTLRELGHAKRAQSRDTSKPYKKLTNHKISNRNNLLLIISSSYVHFELQKNYLGFFDFAAKTGLTVKKRKRNSSLNQDS